MAASLQRYSVFMDQIPVLYSQFPRFQLEKKKTGGWLGAG